MNIYDLRDHSISPVFTNFGPDEGHEPEDRTYLILADESVIKFRLDVGNRIAWSSLEPMLLSRLPGNGHERVDDISVGHADVAIDARCGEDGVRWICAELINRGLLPPSAPVTLLHPTGWDEEIGPLGEVARRTPRPSYH